MSATQTKSARRILSLAALVATIALAVSPEPTQASADDPEFAPQFAWSDTADVIVNVYSQLLVGLDCQTATVSTGGNPVAGDIEDTIFGCKVTFKDLPTGVTAQIVVSGETMFLAEQKRFQAVASKKLHKLRLTEDVNVWMKVGHGTWQAPASRPGDESTPPEVPSQPNPPREDPPEQREPRPKAPPCATHHLGDANCDGVVNAMDYGRAVQRMLGNGDVAEADFNRDGRVDQADLDICRENLGYGL